MLLLLASLWCLWVLRPSRSSATPISEDEKYWRIFCSYLADAGVVRSPGETGAKLTVKARAMLPEHDDLIARLGLAFSKVRFEPVSEERSRVIRMQLKRDLKKLATIVRRSKTSRFAKHTIHSKASATT